MTIKQTQNLLDYLGYAPGTIDGIIGAQTTAAVKAFQTAEGLTADGIPGAKTWEALVSAVTEGRFAKVEEAPASGQPPDFWADIQYFSREEWRCQCGGKYCNGFPAEPAEETVRMADEIRRRAGVPLRVNSGLRCPIHNAQEQGSTNSLHITGQAVDLADPSGRVTPAKLKEIAEAVEAEKIPGRGGLGLYRWGIHIDNGKYSRWQKG